MNQLLERLTFTQEDFETIRDLLQEASGINLNPAKQELVYSRLAKRVRELGLRDFSAYCRRLKSDTEELNRTLNAMTTNVTSFFREAHHFEFLKQTVLPAFSASIAAKSRPFTVWSAGCSTGEEPYSIAMVMRAFFADKPDGQFEITATDIDSDVLNTARAGIYRMRDVEALPPETLKRWFLKGSEGNFGKVRVVPEITRLVRFETHNLKTAELLQPQYDVIFCRNVMIYFDMELRRRIIEGFSRMLRPGGYLFVGHSESLFGLSDAFEVVGRTIHRRR
ncbi:MAG: protein-glutamate O-methyltransferase CheR [Pseudomonadales bacterium]|nr:protein-glutamate O-methyltransferase CheR [Pseudomonadales bacterium]